MPNLLSELLFLFQRLNWLSVIDIVLVASIFFVILLMIRDTQATVLLRGVVFLIILLSLLTTLVNLPAFSWLVRTALPALFLAIPVIFAPEIRRALERLGRAGSGTMFFQKSTGSAEAMQRIIRAVVSASARLSARQHGALIVLQRADSLWEYSETGVRLNASVTPELLLQVFYPNTPLHDGAVIIADGYLAAAACVMPLSASGILNRSPERQMGLRHRAALGVAEASDAIALVVSEGTGTISLANHGRLLKRISTEKLANLLRAFFLQDDAVSLSGFFTKGERSQSQDREDDL